jgi:hypothetical protein
MPSVDIDIRVFHLFETHRTHGIFALNNDGLVKIVNLGLFGMSTQSRNVPIIPK